MWMMMTRIAANTKRQEGGGASHISIGPNDFGNGKKAADIFHNNQRHGTYEQTLYVRFRRNGDQMFVP